MSAMEDGSKRRRPKVYKAHLCNHHMALGAARVVVVVKEQASVLQRCAQLVSSLLGTNQGQGDRQDKAARDTANDLHPGIARYLGVSFLGAGELVRGR